MNIIGNLTTLSSITKNSWDDTQA